MTLTGDPIPRKRVAAGPILRKKVAAGPVPGKKVAAGPILERNRAQLQELIPT